MLLIETILVENENLPIAFFKGHLGIVCTKRFHEKECALQLT